MATKIEVEQLFRDTLFRRGLNTKARVITTTSEINAEFFRKMDANLAILEDLNPEAPITLRLCSHGGHVDETIGAIDRLRASPCRIDIDCFGYAESCGFFLLVLGATGKRRASQNAQLMAHTLAYALPDAKHNQQAQDIKNTTVLINRIIGLLAAKSNRDAAFWRKLMAGGLDHYFTAQQCLSMGVIDEII
jgi:ATP-dependent Clp protease protease subunit